MKKYIFIFFIIFIPLFVYSNQYEGSWDVEIVYAENDSEKTEIEIKESTYVRKYSRGETAEFSYQVELGSGMRSTLIYINGFRYIFWDINKQTFILLPAFDTHVDRLIFRRK